MPEHPGVELALLEATVDAQRSLLRARRSEDVVRTLERVVHVLGGDVVPGHVGGDEVLHLDLALGVRDPLLPWAPPGDPARQRLQRVLPGLIEDARRLLHLLRAREDLGDPALLDESTGALHANATARLVERGRPDDVIVGFAVADTAAIEHVHGHARVEVLLRQLAGFVRSELDVDERLGRVPGSALVAILPHADADRSVELIERVRVRWERRRLLPVALRTWSVRRGSDPEGALADLAAELRAADDEVGATWTRRTADPS